MLDSTKFIGVADGPLNLGKQIPSRKHFWYFMFSASTAIHQPPPLPLSPLYLKFRWNPCCALINQGLSDFSAYRTTASRAA